MSNIREFITYTNWAYLDDCHKKKNLKPCNDLQYDDIYTAESFKAVGTNGQIMPVLTMFRTNNLKESRKFEYNLRDNAYDYLFFGPAISGYAYDAIVKYLKAQKYYGEFAVYINTVSPDNLLFSGKVTILDRV